MTRLVFCDTETTGLDRDRHEPWEIALIVRGPSGEDVEYCWQVRPDLAGASPEGLRIGRYYQRIGSLSLDDSGTGAFAADHPALSGVRVSKVSVAADIARLVDSATIVGAVPDFDAEMLRRWLVRHGQCWTAHYHLVDVETLAAGALRMPPPWSFDTLLGRYGLAYREEDRHTALGDARMVRDLYDAVLAVDR
jgi:DNA polymerase III epsilon subunit-like protein